jgi:hypothetical protein
MDSVISLPVTERPSRVRIAGAGDRESLWDQLLSAAADNAVAPINPEKVAIKLDDMIARHNAIAGVIDGYTGFAGSVGLCFARQWYTDDWHIEDLWCFVHPDYRRGLQNKGHLKALIDFSVWWADQLGLPLFMGVLSDHRALGKIRLYQRLLPQAGAVFAHRPKVA